MRRALLILLLFTCVTAYAESALVTIRLHHRSAREVIGILQPMVDKDGSITGAGYKLFIRSSQQNIDQLRQMLAQIDVATRDLLVSVSMNPEVMQENNRADARVSIQGNSTSVNVGQQTRVQSDAAIPADKSRIKYDVRIFDRTQRQQSPQAQQVRVSEGLWATIHTGQAIPIRSRTRNPDGTVTDTLTYQPVASGFKVLPRIHGDSVTLTIRPQAQSTIAGAGGSYATTEMETTVSGRLGKWIALGSVAQSQNSSGTGIAYHSENHRSESNHIYVKVELIKP